MRRPGVWSSSGVQVCPSAEFASVTLPTTSPRSDQTCQPSRRLGIHLTMADNSESLLRTFDYVFARTLERIDGLSDHEYFWEPVPGCWTLREGADGRWTLDGGGGGG